ncbi:MAG: prepilin-type N-terminal cleavage/methylation domain-containing protein [Planctomycetota bacterium]
MSRSPGYTVVELLVVILILALLAAIVLPTATVGADRKLDTVQLEIQDALDHAQSLAYHQGVPFGVVFNASANWFAVVNQAGVPIDDPLSHGDYVIRLDEPGQPKDVHLEFAIFGSRPVAAFNEKGVLEIGGQVRLRTGADERLLVCDTATHQLVAVPLDS